MPFIQSINQHYVSYIIKTSAPIHAFLEFLFTQCTIQYSTKPLESSETSFNLDIYPIDPKINREHLLSMTNACMKFEKAELNQTLVIDKPRLYMKDRLTDRCKAI